MPRLATIAAIAIASTLSADAFTVSNLPQRSMTTLRMSDDESPTPIPTTERGVSVDQDGKSNVWAIEPKMEVDTKSSDEKASTAIFAAGGLAAFAAVAAGILTNLPDPDQF
eukprot:CAMPEP_0203637612 /NCGR_PEP_ID=MMETSP0088-20131115/3890_1 /ASSEMBLY_ACC=CAM_ASM_001087 /TAXON_ID=426623 /ORGANISM="Chaetoceros affinis, Strain CCMP159" /LENGTH=110 /DNA_ID=CAMNT_0050492085 /DNA_START=26 /DNA_END=358 /DNA_ORIENTATION=-